MKKRIFSFFPAFLKGDFNEMSFPRILSMVVLLACCMNFNPAYAEFSTTDSSNLSSIRTNIQNIWNRINTNFNYSLQNISNQLATISTVLGGINTNLLNTVGWNLGLIGDKQDVLNDLTRDISARLQSIDTKIDTLIQNQETQIQNQETQIHNQEIQIQNQDRLYDYLYEPQYGVLSQKFTLSTKYFNFSNYSDQPDYTGWQLTPVASDSPFFSSFDANLYSITFASKPYGTEQINTPVLLKGSQYIISFSFPSSSAGVFDFFAYHNVRQPISNFNAETVYNAAVSDFGYLTTISFTFEAPYTAPFSAVKFSFSEPVPLQAGGYLMVSISPVPDQVYLEDSFGGSVNSSQSEATDQVQSAQLDFGLGNWADAAAGITYIGSIFLMIWNNSPTQVVVLSLMIGLCVLLLGRGARVAGAVRRSHRDDDGGGG